MCRSIGPSRACRLVKAKLVDAWEMRFQQAHAARDEWKRQLKYVEKQVEDRPAGGASWGRCTVKRILHIPGAGSGHAVDPCLAR